MIRVVARCSLVCAMLLALAVARPAQAVDGEVRVERPAAGKSRVIDTEPGRRYVIAFDPNEAQVRIEGQNFVLVFADGARIAFRKYILLARSGQAPPLRVGDVDLDPDVILGQAVVLSRGQGAVATGARPGGGTETVPVSVRYAGRGYLFACESAPAGHALYSYLLFTLAPREARGAARGRIKAAIRGFLEETDAIAELEARGVPRGEIDALYAPVDPFGWERDCATEPLGDAERMAYRSQHERLSGGMIAQYEAMHGQYDAARARRLLERLGLRGEGPYILSSTAPFLDAEEVAPDRVVVQDLSRLPNRLIRSWVLRFKDRIARRSGRATQVSEVLTGLRKDLAEAAAASGYDARATAGAVGRLSDVRE